MIKYEVHVKADGEQRWYLNGQFHREDGPAIIWADGSQSWYLNGECHREDGPAIIYFDGEQRWYLNGESITKEEHKRRTQPIKEVTIAEIEAQLGYKVKIVKEKQ